MAKRTKKPRSIQSFIMPHLRRASRYWPPKKEARNKAKRKVIIGYFLNGKPKYEDRYICAECTRQGITKLHVYTDTAMDHIIEVASLTGFDSWDATIARMFPQADGYQCICNFHHDQKTQANQEIRRKSKKRIAVKKKVKK